LKKKPQAAFAHDVLIAMKKMFYCLDAAASHSIGNNHEASMLIFFF
jgi:hypothetical protein